MRRFKDYLEDVRKDNDSESTISSNELLLVAIATGEMLNDLSDRISKLENL